jgi:hypothetical protein
VEKHSAKPAEALGAALAYTEEVVDINVKFA